LKLKVSEVAKELGLKTKEVVEMPKNLELKQLLEVV